jgi:hypothetical protein
MADSAYHRLLTLRQCCVGELKTMASSANS